MRKKLYVAGTDLSAFGIVASGESVYDFPERDVKIVSIPGRNGDLIIDQGRYLNIPVNYPISIARNFPENAEAFRAFLGTLRGYNRIVDGYHPDHYRLGCFTGPVEYAVGTLCRHGEAVLKFTCKPQRFLISGESAQTFRSAGKISNPTAEIALPLITVYGSGAGKVTVGGITVEILELTDQITLDCESMNAYRQVGDAAAENKNGSIHAPDFPALQPGDNAVSWTGGISRVEITPRWWTL